ncbi:MAG: tetratricopeptide repeat protein [Bacteroidia bacterium]
MLKRISILISLAFILLYGLSGCSTKKSTWLTRGYHRMNTRYNGYYYAREAIKDGVMKIEKANIDDYSNILPIFVYASKESAKMASGDFEKAIKKCTSAIERHMITDKKNVETAHANSWIEDCFLAIGAARFYKQDYFGAVDAFDYVTKKYVKYPVHYDGFLWLIKTYNETSIFSKSEDLITSLKEDKKFPKKKLFDLFILAADYDIRREFWGAAIPNLTKAITLLEPGGPLKELPFIRDNPMSKHKDQRARLIFILAQLYEKTGDTKKASSLFAQVAHMKPKYDMEFNARLSHARLYDFSGGKGEKVKSELLKMTKDFKNEDYRDQIYYTLAKIELQEHHEEPGIDYLRRSVSVSKKNPLQKALSYLTMADLYYARPDYRHAQAYYDSVVPLIKKDYPNYEIIVAKQKNLNELVKNLTVISTEDSLQKVAGMDTAARNTLIDGIIAKVKEEEKRKEEEKLNQKSNPGGGGTGNTNNNTTATTDAGSWYYTNAGAVSFGIADFKKKWGDRPLEDNWRRINKESTFGDMNAISVGTDKDSVKTVATGTKDKNKGGASANTARAFYLKNLPFTREAREKSNLKIVDAYYNAGMLYKEALFNNPKAAEAFEEMLNRFPDNKYIPTAYYFLYRLYLSMENQEKADANRNIILSKFPDSELALILKNPEKVYKSGGAQDKIKAYYNETYATYRAAQYPETIRRCEIADSLYGGSKLSPKFSYLKALAVGHTGDLKAYELALTTVTVKYPKDEVRNQAMGMLDAIRRVKSGAVATVDSSELKKDKFTFKEDVLHYAVIVVRGRGVNLNDLKINLSNFNQQYFASLNLTITAIPVRDDYQLIQIKEFPDKKGALTYYEFVKGDKDVFKDIPLTTVDVFAMSMENFSVFYHEKNADDYKTFFNANYFKREP